MDKILEDIAQESSSGYACVRKRTKPFEEKSRLPYHVKLLRVFVVFKLGRTIRKTVIHTYWGYLFRKRTSSVRNWILPSKVAHEKVTLLNRKWIFWCKRMHAFVSFGIRKACYWLIVTNQLLYKVSRPRDHVTPQDHLVRICCNNSKLSEN